VYPAPFSVYDLNRGNIRGHGLVGRITAKLITLANYNGGQYYQDNYGRNLQP